MQARAQRLPYCSSQGEAFSFLFSENLKTFRDGVKTAHALAEAASGRAGNKSGSVPGGTRPWWVARQSHSSRRTELEGESECPTVTQMSHASKSHVSFCMSCRDPGSKGHQSVYKVSFALSCLLPPRGGGSGQTPAPLAARGRDKPSQLFAHRLCS